jgi:predicted peptidase
MRLVPLLTILAVQAWACASSGKAPPTPDGSADALPDTSRTDQADAASARAPEAGFSTWTYKDKPMGLYVPAATGKPLPVLLYLHACHNDPVYESYWIIQAANAVEPCAVFLPTAPPSIDFTCADWGGTYDEAMRPNMVDALAELDRVIQQNGFDTKRQYLYGESMGGEGVYRLLMDLPTRFAGAVSAAGYTKDRGAAQMAQTPLWIFHGAEDNTSPVEADQAIYRSIKDAGGTKVKYTEYPGLDHVPGIEQARTEPGLFAWLLGQRR